MLIPVVLGVSLLIFTLMYFVPGNLAQIMLGQSATQDQIMALEEQLGLNDPYIEQLGRFMANTFLRFDLGESYMTGIPVIEELITRFPRTLKLAVGSTAIALLIGVPLGVVAAVNQNKPGDYITMAVALIGISMPNFWLALMLILCFYRLYHKGFPLLRWGLRILTLWYVILNIPNWPSIFSHWA